MAVVTSDFLAGLLTNFRAIFQQDLASLDVSLADYKKICTIFPSTSDKESYAWMGSVPVMSEWKDKRKLFGLPEFDYTLTNKSYEATIEVDRNTIEDDKYGLIAPRIRGLAARAIRYFNEKVFSQLDDGATLLAYDGAAFFGTARTIKDSGTIANRITGGYCTSTTEVLAAMAALIPAMRNFKDDRGVPLNLSPDTIVCSPAMELLIKNALVPAVAGTTRPETGYFPTIISTPWIDATSTTWYALCTKAEVLPVLLQLRKEPEVVALDDPKSEHVFMNRTFLYGVDSRFQVGYGDPRTAIQVVDS